MTALVLPPALVHRPMRADDAALWADLLAAAEEVDRRGEHYDAADCAEELANPELDLDRDTTLVLDGTTAVAYQVLHRQLENPSGPRMFAEGLVRPDHRGRGIGTALLATARTAARDAGARLLLRIGETVTDAAELAVDAGLEPLRWWSDLHRDLAEPVHPVPAPDGLTITPLGPPYDAARWDEPLRLAHNSAFADHWGSSPDTPEAWVHWRTGSRAFRPACSVAALDAGGAVAGYVLSFEYEADTASTGSRDLYVGTVGTLRAWRGRGVAGAMLARVLATAQAAGYRTSSLTVDAANPTGALGVYERAGYRLLRRAVTYAAPLP